MKGIREIFKFYAKQQNLYGNKATFDVIDQNLEEMNQGEFLKLLKDFNILGNAKVSN